MNLNVVTDAEDHVLPLDDIPLEVPIPSVRNIVRKGNCVTFRDGGGYIHNVKKGHNMRFAERQGVYFIKVQSKAPSCSKASEG